MSQHKAENQRPLDPIDNMEYYMDDAEEDEDDIQKSGGRRHSQHGRHGAPIRPSMKDEGGGGGSDGGNLGSGLFTQGETRDFLHFLRRINYDHRQCPENEVGGEFFQALRVTFAEMPTRKFFLEPKSCTENSSKATILK
ncbi:unnamed protein product [Cylicocyclus nassatus]|uniref:Uncharacterized protein n=1 Tax=Cylicocyclus nassatus TaxID=53992 RepID=A0AA36H6N7_CYLNA|nr:unnamed protein product [Cylicocyclus nassatus]